ncbi:hypothetical protein BDD43_4356 [Mucilaginibacter gracilis]|uniref:Lipoprotein n=1 Tax=Mucilaginibacter gracilis TaxID=423350 RepID=A0A495J7Y2_9SPHI|nr:hypothetical protein [Mucilaginibacter gracilis]RKR84129.1 hypothetical protein BDD43_4356 [Mucilaginibacter gracilis]
MKLQKIHFVLICLSVVLGSCADLKHINTFSATAVKTINSYNDVGYTFTSSYNDYTLKKNAYNFEGDVANNVLSLPTVPVIADEPKTAMDADKAITLYITSITSYFDGLSKLSDKDLVNYNFDEVTKDLKNQTALKTKLHIDNDDKIDAASSIAKVFTNEIMGAYREGKLKEVMIKYDGQVSLCIQTLIDILNKTVLPHIDADKVLVDGKYQVVLANKQIDMGKKIDIIKDYQAEQATLNKNKEQISQIITALEKIKDEHNKTVVALKTEKLSSKAVIDIVNTHSAEIYQLYTNIKTLTK